MLGGTKFVNAVFDLLAGRLHLALVEVDSLATLVFAIEAARGYILLQLRAIGCALLCPLVGFRLQLFQ